MLALQSGAMFVVIHSHLILIETILDEKRPCNSINPFVNSEKIAGPTSVSKTILEKSGRTFVT